MKQSTTKLLAGAAFVALAGIALPASAQEVPATSAPTQLATPPIVLQTAPAPAPVPIAPAQSSPAPAPDVASGLLATQRSIQAATGVTPDKAPAPEAATKPAKTAVKPAPASTRAQPATVSAEPAKAAAPTTPVATPPIENRITPAPVNDGAIVASQPVPAAPVSTTTTAAQTAVSQPDWTLIGGIAGVGGIALLGFGAAAGTRRRSAVRRISAPVLTPAERVAERDRAPAEAPLRPAAGALATVRAGAMEPEVATSPSMTGPGAPGRHMAAAYNGPSAENPFVTLRARMRRARFLDQREAATMAAAPLAAPAAAPTSAPRAASVSQDQTVYVMGKTNRSRFFFRPGMTKS